ncbi:uncharacterized protein DUF1573 [Mariniflexile fucanivorans]|uniref:Uncharacterized protein DUF1573 n=1 Tax=Mariniflexile fucanivorans TaxID=264023 RepID=A0A4R1RDI9_9FLAO|nr:DUF1573 domain-containing protein [Mariniflexile fucanivorans]TCL63921.1 uncharacterized protein DUF1573 [Mariniflexile fucanivorans]
MKKIILGIVTLGLVAFTSCKDDASKKINEANVAAAAERDSNASKLPILTFDKTEHDFGDITKGVPVKTEFTYKNTGTAPLVLTDIKTSCGCTVPQDWSREPLAPGKTAKFTVDYNASGPNKITKTITVSANTEKGSEVVKITANVIDPNAK